ncbi:MAG: hypothetical protein AABY22_00145 [Nanoarchaeota archaeon]
MTLKQQIAQGTEILLAHKKLLSDISILIEKKDDKAMLAFLLDIQKMESEDRIKNVESRLNSLKKDYIIQFEKDSAECNMNMEDVIKVVDKWIGKEPLGITDQILPLIALVRPFMDQERKNDIYSELKGHLNFLKNTYRNK